MRETISFFRRNFKFSGGVNQIIFLHCLVFAIMVIIGLVAHFVPLAGHIYPKACHLLWLSPNLQYTLLHPWTLLTYNFVPNNIERIYTYWYTFLYMSWLYAFGSLFIRFYNSSSRLLALYLTAPILSGLLTVLVSYFVPQLAHSLPLNNPCPALYAVMTATTAVMPNYPFYLFFQRVKLKYVTLFFFLGSLLHLLFMPRLAAQGFAEIVGILYGYIYVYLIQKVFNRRFVTWMKARFRRKKKRPLYMRPKKKGTKAASSSERMHAILDKIEKEGYQSLSQEDKEELFRAGK